MKRAEYINRLVNTALESLGTWIFVTVDIATGTTIYWNMKKCNEMCIYQLSKRTVFVNFRCVDF
jgi:hypothetical protein